MREFMVKVNGEMFQVEVEEVRTGKKAAPVLKPQSISVPAAPVQKQKPKPESNISDNNVIAPMPGTILAINAKEGDQVNAGDVIVVLEAMKLENNLNTQISGTVKAIHTNVGASVNPGDVLVEIE